MFDSLQTESLSGLLPVWTVACQAPLAMGFSRQELWSGLPFPSPGGLPDPRIKPESPTLQAVSLPSEPLENPKSFIPASLKLHLLGNALFSREEPVWTPACRDCSLPGSFGHGIFQARTLEWIAISFSRDLPDPRIEPESPTLQADSLPSEPLENPKSFNPASLKFYLLGNAVFSKEAKLRSCCSPIHQL